MRWQDKMRFTGNYQFTACYRIETAFFQVFDFSSKDNRIDDHAVTDQIQDLFVEDAGRDGVQDIFLLIKFQRVSGIRTALKTCDQVVLRTKNVDNFTLTFIAPLQAQKYINLHNFLCVEVK